jgi:hypothetical protein
MFECGNLRISLCDDEYFWYAEKQFVETSAAAKWTKESGVRAQNMKIYD